MDRLDTETLWENKTRQEWKDVSINWFDILTRNMDYIYNMPPLNGRLYWDMAAENEEEGWYD